MTCMIYHIFKCQENYRNIYNYGKNVIIFYKNLIYYIKAWEDKTSRERSQGMPVADGTGGKTRRR